MHFSNTLYELFHRKNFEYHVDPRKLFYEEFNKIPSTTLSRNIDTWELFKYFKINYKSIIKNIISVEREDIDFNRFLVLDEVYFILNKNIILYLNREYNLVNILFDSTSKDFANHLRKQVIWHRIIEKKKSLPEIEVIINKGSRITTETKEIKPVHIDIDENYNNDFLEEHKTIIERLKKDNDKGIVLLHGIPGTGKTNYIKYLSGKINKKIIFMPPNLAASITSPRLMELMFENPNSVLIIEDAERIIRNRDQDKNSPISALLNLSDGLLSDCLNIQIICTFNTDLSNVDQALMRKGRLISKYEFKALEVKKANTLSKKLGYNAHFTEPQVLSNIYNQNEKNRNTKKKSIGFLN